MCWLVITVTYGLSRIVRSYFEVNVQYNKQFFLVTSLLILSKTRVAVMSNM
jgi:hypothetical protein